jgi:prevent-host-death family protein
MKTVGAYEAKTKFAELLDAVERGEEITITRRGKAIARLIPCSSDEQRDPNEVIDRIKKLRAGIRLGPGLTIRDLIEEGRR